MCYTDSRNHLWPNTTCYIDILTTISNTNKYKQIWVALVISCTIFCLLVILTSWISFDKMCLVTRTIAVNSSVIDRWIVQMWKLSVLIIWTHKIMTSKCKKNRIGYVLKSDEVRTLVSRRYSENSFHTRARLCIPNTYSLMPWN